MSAIAGFSTSPTGYIIVSNCSFVTTNTTTSTIWIGGGSGSIGSSSVQAYVPVNMKEVEAPVLLLKGHSYKMPNGAMCHIDDVGGFHIDDKDAKVIYRASRVYDFNQYLNGSDLLEEYISELAPHGIRQDQVLKIPIINFINWLIHRAMEKDNEAPPKDIPRIPVIADRFGRCRLCGRFILRRHADNQIYFCSPDHMSEKLRRLDLCQRQLTMQLD